MVIRPPAFRKLFFRKLNPAAAPDAPASGYRNSNWGTFDAVGIWGYSWSGSAGPGVTVRFLGLYEGYMHPSNANHHAHGLPLRCVQAFTGRFSGKRKRGRMQSLLFGFRRRAEDFRGDGIPFPASRRTFPFTVLYTGTRSFPSQTKAVYGRAFRAVTAGGRGSCKFSGTLTPAPALRGRRL